MSQDVTQLLANWRNGDEAARDELIPLVYDELHRLAKSYLSRERHNHTFQATSLVNEAYLRLARQTPIEWQSRAHFFGIAAQVMRHLLVDYARARQFAKRGGGALQITLDEATAVAPETSIEFIALHEALNKLARLDERKARIVELRYFGGLSADETAEVMGLSEITIKREWLKAKAWLYQEMNQP